NSQGIEVIRTQVGDRYVAEKMRENNLSLGGEQSGHVILGEYSTTGDGLVAALQMLALIQEKNKPVSELTKIYTPLPQIIRNVKVDNLSILDSDAVQNLIEERNKTLKNIGRLLVRKSGTEKLIRVMGEGDNIDLIKEIIDEIEQKLLLKS
ncbi:MAG: phosphoglucosamine mutase, partial [Pseudomonadota bacterium]